MSKNKLSQSDKAQVQEEVKILKRLEEHEHIVTMVDDFEDETNFHIVLEIVDGGELFDRIVSKTFYTEKQARDVVRFLLQSIQYCHHRNIIHRF